MCCDSCPKYEECSVKDRLRDDCCKVCPDYGNCYPDEEEERENLDE